MMADLDPDGLIDAMVASVAEAWPGPVVIAAHSIGASFGWLMANQQSIAVRGLVSISGHLFGVRNILRNLLSLNALPLRISLADAIVRALIVPGQSIRTVLDRSSLARSRPLWPFLNLSRIDAGDLVGKCFRGNGGIGALRLLNMARQIDLLNVLEHSNKSTSVVFGGEDPLLTPGDNAQLGRFANIKSIRRVDTGRHFPIIEAPIVLASATIKA